MSQVGDLLGGDVGTILGAQQVLEQDLEAVRQAVGTVDLGDVVDLVGLAVDVEGSSRVEAVDTHVDS